MKAGTTSLRAYLGAHPDVFMAEPKELDFFLDDGNWRRGVEWYRDRFAGGRGAAAPGGGAPPPPKPPGGAPRTRAHRRAVARRPARVRRARSDRAHAVAVEAERGVRGRDPLRRSGAPRRPALPRLQPLCVPARSVHGALRP